eukprot:764869-Hanusia_phi.AAC.3
MALNDSHVEGKHKVRKDLVMHGRASAEADAGLADEESVCPFLSKLKHDAAPKSLCSPCQLAFGIMTARFPWGRHTRRHLLGLPLPLTLCRFIRVTTSCVI